jgi:flagellar hook assembly protein FlgD
MTENARISFTLAERGSVRLTVFDLRGRRMRTLLDETMEAGPQSPVWDGRAEDGRRVGSGIYWVRLEAADRVFTGRLAVIR